MLLLHKSRQNFITFCLEKLLLAWFYCEILNDIFSPVHHGFNTIILFVIDQSALALEWILHSGHFSLISHMDSVRGTPCSLFQQMEWKCVSQLIFKLRFKTHQNISSFFSFFHFSFSQLKSKPKASCVLGKQYTAELHIQLCIYLFLSQSIFT